MIVQDYIKQKFSYIGEMTDVGASAFALDFGFDESTELTEDLKRSVSKVVNDFTEKNLLRPTSVGESGFSSSWNTETIKNYALIMLKKYGITPNSDLSSMLGLSVIKDVTDSW